MQSKHQQSKNQASIDDWMSYTELQELFNYKPTQMAALLNQLVVTQVGRRKFVLKDSVEKLLDENVR
jgi:hypothetical protein